MLFNASEMGLRIDRTRSVPRNWPSARWGHKHGHDLGADQWLDQERRYVELDSPVARAVAEAADVVGVTPSELVNTLLSVSMWLGHVDVTVTLQGDKRIG